MLVHKRSVVRCQSCGNYFDDEFSYRNHLDKMHGYACSRDYWMKKAFVKLPLTGDRDTCVVRHVSIEATPDGDVEVHRYREGNPFVPEDTVILGARKRRYFPQGMREIYDRAFDSELEGALEADLAAQAHAMQFE